MHDELGAILTYRNNGTRKPCGQTMDADGSGDFAIVFYGNEVGTKARNYAESLMANQEYWGQITLLSFIKNEETFCSGPTIKVIEQEGKDGK